MFPAGLDGLIHLGAVGGLAVIHGLRGFDKQLDFGYRAMYLILQRIRGSRCDGQRGAREHMTREFASSRDLYVRTTGRLAQDEYDVLPDTVGHTADGRGHRWSVKELVDRGREAAEDARYRNPTNKHAIHFGLFEAARLNPLEIPESEVPNLVRLALYDIAPSEAPPDRELAAIVEERLLSAVFRHLGDNTDQFNQWFSGRDNSVVKQIAQQKNQPGGVLKQEDVRRALLHLGLKAYEYVGECLHCLMRTIKISIPDSLGKEESRLFELMYEKQPCFGNLPMALLAERMGFMRRAILGIWETPVDKSHVGVLHRLLQYYAEMASRRRQADRQIKERSPAVEEDSGEVKAITNTVPITDDDLLPPDPGAYHDVPEGEEDARPVTRGRYETSYVDNRDSRAEAGTSGLFHEVGELIRDLHNITCKGGCTEWEYQRLNAPEDSVRLLVRCECGGVSMSVQMSMSEFEKRARQAIE